MEGRVTFNSMSEEKFLKEITEQVTEQTRFFLIIICEGVIFLLKVLSTDQLQLATELRTLW